MLPRKTYNYGFTAHLYSSCSWFGLQLLGLITDEGGYTAPDGVRVRGNGAWVMGRVVMRERLLTRDYVTAQEVDGFMLELGPEWVPDPDMNKDVFVRASAHDAKSPGKLH
jgi:hypothetical protein